MLHGMVRDVKMRDSNPADKKELVEIKVTFITDKSNAADLLAALADEPYVALLGEDYYNGHYGKYAKPRKAVS